MLHSIHFQALSLGYEKLCGIFGVLLLSGSVAATIFLLELAFKPKPKTDLLNETKNVEYFEQERKLDDFLVRAGMEGADLEDLKVLEGFYQGLRKRLNFGRKN